LKDDVKDIIDETKIDKRKRGLKSVPSGAVGNNELDNGIGKSRKTETSSISGVKPMASYFAASTISATTKSKKNVIEHGYNDCLAYQLLLIVYMVYYTPSENCKSYKRIFIFFYS
jgi:hypothetical protein